MADENEIKQQVRHFYDQTGWQMVSDGMYQNARYEDLRPVAHAYIHRCHLRVGRYLQPSGKYLLDAGSGPIQYPEYLTYSQNYAYRVCADISIVALQEARKRIGEQGLFVVADVANLPFKDGIFDGEVSLHTLHHLPEEDQWQAYNELYRVLRQGCSAVVVNGWTVSVLMQRLQWLERFMERAVGRLQRGLFTRRAKPATAAANQDKTTAPTGTFVQKINAARLKEKLQGRMPFEIRVWRTVSTRFLRAVFQPWLGGSLWLRLLFFLEERFPAYFGEQGQYPLVIVRKLNE
jgi:ubiquinone/menaquinone biosynthesis C-methylase UbiE